MKIMLYPMNHNLVPLTRNYDLLSEYNTIYPVAPKSFGYDKEDISAFDGGAPSGIYVTSDYKQIMSDVDAVLIDYSTSMLPLKNYNEVISSALNDKKSVLLSTNPQERFLKESFGFEVPIGNILSFSDKKAMGIKEKRLLEMPVPIVMVFGSGENTNKFDIQLALRKEFESAGYKITQFGTKPYSSLFGFEPLPNFIFSKDHLAKKVLDFNHYVYENIERDDSDIAIVGVPGGIMPINPHGFDECGELAFLISMALRPDETILSLYADDYSREMLENLFNICKYRFNTVSTILVSVITVCQ